MQGKHEEAVAEFRTAISWRPKPPHLYNKPGPRLVPAGRFRLEVSNGNGVTGMAGKVGRFLGGQGYRTPRLTNRKPFQVATSQIQYRPGHREEAQRLQSSLPGEPALAHNDSAS